MFDSNDPKFRNAASIVAEVFDLTITLYPVNSKGQIKYEGEIVDVIGSGNNKVNIAQFGLLHFQLIISSVDNERDSNFLPAVAIDGNLKFIDNEDDDDNRVKLEIMIIDLNSDILEYKKHLKC